MKIPSTKFHIYALRNRQDGLADVLRSIMYNASLQRIIVYEIFKLKRI